MEKTNIIIEDYSSQKLDHQKIVELEIFKNKVDSMLITHEIRINNNIQDLVKFQAKYDEAIMNNLRVPGFIGPSCKFRNISEYISNNISEISRVISDKDQIKKDTKDFKNKIDSIMKQIIVLNDSSIQRCIEYVDKKHKDTELLIDGKISELAEKNQEIRVLFSEFKKFIKEKINSFNSEINRALNMKNDLMNIIDEKFEEIKKDVNDVNKKVIINIQDIGILKKKVNDLNEFNSYYKRHYSNKKNNFLKKRESSNMIDVIKNREDKNYLKKNNYFSAKANKQSEFLALNVDSITESLLNINTNLFTINNKKYDLNKIPQIIKKEIEQEKEKEKEKENTMSIKKLDLNKNEKEKISRSEYVSKKKNIIQNKTIENYKILNKENRTKINSFDSLSLKQNFIKKYSKPFILDQRILSDADLKTQKEKKAIKKEIIKKNLQKNLLNLRVISGNNPLDLYNYSTSVPRLSSFPKKEKEKEKKINNVEEVKNKDIKLKTLNNINYDKTKLNINTNINCKFVNLELEENVSINPETNNGAYIIAQKQIENSNVTKLNIIPTSYVNVYDISNRSERLMNVTFAKEGLKNKNI